MHMPCICRWHEESMHGCPLPTDPLSADSMIQPAPALTHCAHMQHPLSDCTPCMPPPMCPAVRSTIGSVFLGSPTSPPRAPPRPVRPPAVDYFSRALSIRGQRATQLRRPALSTGKENEANQELPTEIVGGRDIDIEHGTPTDAVAP
jgi:hypothetical protein